MSMDDTWRQVQTLPPERQQEVRDFVEFLAGKYWRAQEPAKAVRKSFVNGPYFGMWRDRDEMKDSACWVRQLREQAT